MTRMSLLPFAALGLALAFATPSLAQHGPMGNPCTDVSARAESRLTFLHNKLAIAQAQESAFGTYAAAVRAASQNFATVCASLPATAPTAFPDKFDSHLKMMAAHVQEMTALSAPNRTFYSALTAAQQSTLDNLHAHGPKH